MVYGPIVTHVFPVVQVESYRHSVLYVNLVSVVDCSVLNWVEQRELRFHAELGGAEGVRSIIWEDSGAWLGVDGPEQQL